MNWNLEDFISQQEKNEKLKAEIVLEKIKIRQQRKNDKIKKIEELNYEKDLIVDDIINIVKKELNCSKYNLFTGFFSDTFHNIWRYFHYKEEIKKREIEQIETVFNYVTSQIKEKILLNDENFELTKVVDSCYGRHYVFEYSYKNHNFYVYIPMFDKANDENYAELLEGYKIYYKKSEYHDEIIAYGLDYDEVAKELKEFIQNLGE